MIFGNFNLVLTIVSGMERSGFPETKSKCGFFWFPRWRVNAIKLRNIYWNPNLQIWIISFRIKHFQS
jgi:hypothetical protein